MHRPTIVDLHKKNGARPEFDLYAGRAVDGTEFLEDSKWCNPFPVEKYHADSFDLFEIYMRALLRRRKPDWSRAWRSYPAEIKRTVENAHRNAVKKFGIDAWNLDELTNKRIGCWCKIHAESETHECHVQIIIGIWMEEFGEDDDLW